MFNYLVGLVALIVASCAAFFSVQGLANLYAGQFLAVCIMASSLEVGKLVAASYLQRYWNKTAGLLKTYLVTAVLILMCITSLGIFGFLTGAYQANNSKVELVDSKQDNTNSKKVFLEQEIASLNQRLVVLNNARESQEKRLSGLSSRAAKPVYDDIERSGKEISEIHDKINNISKEVLNSGEQIIELTEEKHKSSDIGTLQFVAKIFEVPVDLVVKWLTLAIVFVFDPLAICLILAFNSVQKKYVTEETIVLPIKPTDLPITALAEIIKEPVEEPVEENIHEFVQGPGRGFVARYKK